MPAAALPWMSNIIFGLHLTNPCPRAPPAAAAITPGRLKDKRTSQLGVARSQLLTGACEAAPLPPCARHAPLPRSILFPAATHRKRCRPLPTANATSIALSPCLCWLA
jgi:hypothetical protein